MRNLTGRLLAAMALVGFGYILRCLSQPKEPKVHQLVWATNIGPLNYYFATARECEQFAPLGKGACGQVVKDDIALPVGK